MKRKIIIGLLLVTLSLSIFGCATESEASSKSVKEMYNDDIYEFIDPDTGVHYWIYSHGAGYVGMGGITPRLNSDGSIMVD